jgi:4-diphosphocytidyl-2C-methyl-D-erythritol kinase
MNRLFGMRLGRPALVDLANRLGSDVAFFVSGRRFAIGRGRGGELTGASVPAGVRLWHVLFVPPKNIITKDVYASLTGVSKGKTGKNPQEILTLTKIETMLIYYSLALNEEIFVLLTGTFTIG